MRFTRGDHVCSLYSTDTELVRQVAGFLVEGLRNRERCWYVAAGSETQLLVAELCKRGVDVDAETGRGALRLLAGAGAYVVHGSFNPETTIGIFNDAVEQAYTDGFRGFRAAAEMSWATDCPDGADQVIVYEALLKSLFANCGAIGLCLYNRDRMPLGVINGALATHPLAGTHGHYGTNPFYEPTATRMPPADEASVRDRLKQLDRSLGANTANLCSRGTLGFVSRRLLAFDKLTMRADAVDPLNYAARLSPTSAGQD